MNPKVQNLEEWLADNHDRIFRYWVYRKMFTPFEEENKFMDESHYEDDIAMMGYIRNAIILPDNDVLLEFELDDIQGHYNYVKLSEIRLERDERDMDMEEFEDEDSEKGEEQCRSWKIISNPQK